MEMLSTVFISNVKDLQGLRTEGGFEMKCWIWNDQREVQSLRIDLDFRGLKWAPWRLLSPLVIPGEQMVATFLI